MLTDGNLYGDELNLPSRDDIIGNDNFLFFFHLAGINDSKVDKKKLDIVFENNGKCDKGQKKSYLL